MPEINPTQTPPRSAAADPGWGALLDGLAGLDRLALITRLRADQLRRWQVGQRIPAETYLREVPALRDDPELAIDLIFSEFLLRRDFLREAPALDEYLARFPQHATVLRHQLELDALAQEAAGTQGRGDRAPATAAAPKGASVWTIVAAGDDARAAAPGAPALPGYEVLGELGRGGMGLVLRGRDLHLGRDLAVKLLRDDLQGQPHLVRRFVNEARICGRLQHPGVVPVHALGTLPDGRPFFTMKLVEGRTLADLLDDRTDPTQDWPRLLGIFEQVCQAVAYAHSKGVIHRDLKPHNVMVGAFGEVQVMDWGLAKVLDRGAEAAPAEGDADDPGLADRWLGTQLGHVLGTLPYMPPEQARGEVGRMDERCDVFSLGAILCEILTGRPPFAGRDGAELLARARACDHAEALARLGGCGADAELVRLAKACLAAEPSDRPRDAGVVARELTAYLAGVQERLRTAEVEKAAEQARAAEARATAAAERRARRRTALLAAALLALVGAALVGGLVVDRERAKTLNEQQGKLEQQRKAREAQVRALLDVAPQAVPAVLAALEDYRDEIRPRLVQAAEEPEPQDVSAEASRLWRQHRARAGLALLAEDPGQVAPLSARLLEEGLDPAEMRLVRDALRPHAAALTDDLWRRAGEGSPAGRFRALVALAAYDPGSPRWGQAAAGAVGEILSANPLYLGPWVEALRPVRDHLMVPLGRVYRGAEPRLGEYRQVAANVLADYAADQPDVLADLLMDGDERQYAVLFPRVQAHRERAVTRLTAELDRVLAPDWKDAPLDPSWEQPDAALVRQVEGAAGMMGERFALGQALPLAEFDALAEGLRKAGYRLVNFRPYAHKPDAQARGSVLVAALWTRDGQEAAWAHGLTVDEATKRDAEMHGRGLVPRDVAGYLPAGDGGAEPRYAVLWGPKESGTEDVQFYVGVPADRHRAAREPLQNGNYVPRTGTQVNFDGRARYSAVWWKPGRTLETKHWSFWDNEEAYGQQLTPSHLQLDLRLAWDPEELRDLGAATFGVNPSAGLGGVPWAALVYGNFVAEGGLPGLVFAATWIDSATHVSKEVHGLDPAAHLTRIRELAAQGYRPAALTVVESSGRHLLAGSVWHRPVVPEVAKDALAKRQAQAAVALLHLGATERVWPLLEHRPDPRLRSFLIHRLAPLAADPALLLARLEEEREPSRRRALVLSLGAYPVDRLDAALRAKWPGRLRQWYHDEPDAGLHGAVEWLLRRWGDGAEVVRMEKELAKASPGRQPGEKHQWYVNGQGQTLVKVPAGPPFWMGSPGDESGRLAGAEPLHQVRIPRSFAIAAKEVTVEQFKRFKPNHRYSVQYSPRDDGPMGSVTWYDAAAYCNWLSEQEGIPKAEWCYLPNERTGEYAAGMRLAPGALGKRGYRLPTEAEWEYACRAGAVTRRYYGDADDLLGEYAWYNDTTKSKGTRAGGLLKPNDLGLFDLYGNVLEWVQDPAFAYGWPGREKPIKDGSDMIDIEFIDEGTLRTARGGSFDIHALLVRSAHRLVLRPSNDDFAVGFRVARTHR